MLEIYVSGRGWIKNLSQPYFIGNSNWVGIFSLFLKIKVVLIIFGKY